MSHFEDDFARHSMQANYKRKKLMEHAGNWVLDLKPIKMCKHDQKIMDMCDEEWDEIMVIPDLETNN